MLESPSWTGAVALAAAVAALAAAAVTGGRALLALARGGLARAADEGAPARALAVDASALVGDVAAIVAPVVVAAALGALVAGAALARGVFVPRRQVRGAPTIPDGAGPRAVDATLALARALILLAVGSTFVVGHLGGVARLAIAGAGALGPALLALAVAALAHVAAATVALALVEVLVRHRRLAAALRMTDREARDDQRETAGAPAMRRHQRARGSDPRDRIARAAVVVVGARTAAALRWRPGMESAEVVAAGTGLAAHQLLAAARHRGVPVVTDEELASLGPGLVPAAHRPRAAAVLVSLGAPRT